eukprot:gene12691-14663_t
MDIDGGGRGRGRGRGGVPVLPEGMWDALQGSSESKTVVQEVAKVVEREDSVPEQYEDSRHAPSMPMGFGRGPGRGDFGRGGRGGGRGRGPERDAKGKDWECPSCTNVNWSWRSNCNKCNTAKPASALSEAENRDGAGKGFNERQDRISAAAVEIDEEGFDDFGRRVKKEKEQQASSRRAKEEAALARMNEKYKHLVPLQSVGSPQDEAKSNANGAPQPLQRSEEDRQRCARDGSDRVDRDTDRDRGSRNDRDRERTAERVRSPPRRDNDLGRDKRDDSRRDDRLDDRREDNRRDDNRARDTTERDRGNSGREEGRKRERSADRRTDSARDSRDYRDNRGGRDDRNDNRGARSNRDSRDRDSRQDKYSRH